jgi:hypothetical protein
MPLVQAVGVSVISIDECPEIRPQTDFAVAGANLMGSDLYNNLIRYFIVHLKNLKDVCWLLSFDLTNDQLCPLYSDLITFKMKPCYDTTLRNGTDTRQVPTISIDCSHTSTVTG